VAIPRIWRPRMLANLTVPILGTREQRINQAKNTEALELTVRPKRIRLESNDHNEADRLTLTADWTECGVDPRILDDAVVTLWIGTADEFGDWTLSTQNARFIGLARGISARRSADAAAEVELDCVDYTTLFLNAKPFGSSGIPDYTQRLDEAWQRICEQTPGAEALADAIVLEGLDEFPLLGKAVAERFRKLKQVPTKPETDAWAVWQQCCGMVGLISFMRLDKCVVTTATNYYTELNPSKLIWGRNLLEWSEHRDTDLAGKGVGLTSFDPISGTTIEAFYPPIGDDRVKRKKAGAKKLKGKDAAAMRQREDRDYFALPGVTNADVLADIAQRVWEERSRQELEGQAVTRDMWTETEDQSVFDLLTLKAGDSVSVQIDPRENQILGALPTDGSRELYLTNRGYTEQVARLIVANMKEFTALGSTFHVRSVSTELETDREGGSFSVSVNYINRIKVGGGT
jgi:hypothetical protein